MRLISPRLLSPFLWSWQPQANEVLLFRPDFLYNAPMIPNITSDAAIRFLQQHPKFFEEHADALAQIYIPHPHGGRAISLSERQILTLRDKVRGLEHQIGDFIAIGRENDALSEKMHRLSLALLRSPEALPDQILRALEYHLREDFAVPHVTVRLWGLKHDHAVLPEASEVSEAVRAAVNATGAPKLPFCGALKDVPFAEEVGEWFGAAGKHLASAALMPIVCSSRSGGVLVLASEDPKRFFASMGTLYVERLAELTSAALGNVFAGN